MIALVFSPMPHTKSISWHIFYHLLSMTYPKMCASHDYCLVSRRHSRSRPAFRVASLAPEATLRCMWRLRTAIAPWSSSWSLRGPLCTRPPNTAVAPEGFSGRFGSGSDEVKGFVHWQLIFVLCFGMLSGTRTCCLRIHFCDGMGLLKFG